MKRILLFTIAFTALAITSKAQQSYWTNQGEYIFSWSGYTGSPLSSNSGQTRTRFSLFPNTEVVYNLDSKGLLGTYFGLSLRNVGLNWGDPEKHKRRSLSVGVPLAFKIGDLENDNFFFFGGEAELFFHYKKKDWDADGTKIKSSEFMSDELNLLQPSAMVGYCMNHFMFKVKYYFFDFFNEDFTNDLGEQPYLGSQSNIFYFSFAFRTELGGNNFDFDDEDEDEADDGFDFGYKPLLDDLYRDI